MEVFVMCLLDFLTSTPELRKAVALMAIIGGIACILLILGVVVYSEIKSRSQDKKEV